MVDEPGDEPQGDLSEYASSEEAADEIHALSKADRVRLALASRRHFRHYALQRFLEHPRELLHEAVVATLDGSQPWRKTRRSMREHLDRVMWSRASKHVERGRVRRAELLRGVPLDDPNKAPPLAGTNPGPDRVALARIELQRVEGLFSNDRIALIVLRARARGVPRSVVLSEAGISETEYDTVSKRVRRRILEDLNQDGE